MLINGDAAAVPLEDGTVHCVVTSPPYWSLRKYAGEQERDWPEVKYSPMPGLPELTVDPMRCALGLESTPEAYIGHMVLVFREVWRVLRGDGVAWCVIGDSFSSGGRKGHGNRIGHKQQTNHGMSGENDPPRSDSGLHDGDLVMVPHRLALALQGDGWVVRNDVVWNKLNPMPESVRGWTWQRCRVKVSKSGSTRAKTPYAGSSSISGAQSFGLTRAGREGRKLALAEWSNCPGCDKCEANDGYVLRRGSWRHTRAHEVVLMLVKGMGYFANQEAVREATTGNAHSRGNGLHPKSHQPGMGVKQNESFSAAVNEVVSARNPRSVLTLSGESYAGAHYAVFPTKLIAPLIRATCPAKCCPKCGTGWAPVVEKETTFESGSGKAGNHPNGKWKEYEGTGLIGENLRMGPTVTVNVLGYRPSCKCGVTDHIPGIVLDPFVGSGTAGMVAKELGLRWIGLDLAHEYLDRQAKIRTQTGVPSDALDGLPMFADAGGETSNESE